MVDDPETPLPPPEPVAPLDPERLREIQERLRGATSDRARRLAKRQAGR